MKIGLLHPTIYASNKLFPGKIFAPNELLTELSNQLVENGHEVTMFTSADFPTKAKIEAAALDYIPNTPDYFKFRGLPPDRQAILKEEYAKRRFELETVIRAVQVAKDQHLDVLHCYHDSSFFITHYLESLSPCPIVYTLHDPLPPPESYEFQEFSRFTNHKYISISNSQRNSRLKLNFISTVYHGVPVDKFTFGEKPSDYLLFMGRLTPEKGLHSAIKVALELNLQLEIGTHFPDHDGENPYFEKEIKQYLENPLIGEPGMVEGEDKQLLYKQARALLFPIEWEEPFGMVMVEAMACGTPVIAYNRGSVPEIVRDGVTGFIVEPEVTGPAAHQPQNQPSKGHPAFGGAPRLASPDGENSKWVIKKRGVEGLIEAVKRIGEIDRRACRKHVEENFTVEKMVENHVNVYKKIINRGQGG